MATMGSATDERPETRPANLARLDRAVVDLEAAAARLAERASAAAETEAELARLRLLHQTVSGRLDALIARLHELLQE